MRLALIVVCGALTSCGLVLGIEDTSVNESGDAGPNQPDADPNQPDADPSLPDADPNNSAPAISGIDAPNFAIIGKEASIACNAADPDNDNLQFSFTVSAGSVTSNGEGTTLYVADVKETIAQITCAVSDGRGGTDELTVDLKVLVDPTDNRVHLELNGDANDSGPAGNDGTITGATLATDRFGNANAALSFDGTDDFVTLANESQFDLTGYTISAWVSVGASTDHRELVAKSSDNFGPYSYRFLVDAGGNTDKLGATYVPTGGGNFSCGPMTNKVFDTTDYVHVALTFNGTQIQGFADGAAGSSTCLAGLPTPAQNNDPVTIGKNGFGNFFVGTIDDFRIYSRVLSQQEIEAIAGNDSF